ncbi:glycosyl transferase [Salinibacterium sp. SYSU T00001]|uniref:macrolide family glycosyltransferase n=1 Tax=Homoserinimonas sedimenticola TaxID=2986805 RepID=UPI0022369379|nr:macrolide family glycosyltransferase [Salinibacterium sedimenticola]MCW4385192.1 glycosyl transferase [Salinibacterium sedimenticola]
MPEHRHILMVASTAPSHIYPSLALMRELVARGHRVSYAVGEELASLVRPTGVEVFEHPSILPRGDEEWPADPGEAMRVFLDEGIAVLPLLAERFDDDRPDLVLYDIGGHPGPILAARYGVPAVQLSPAFVAWDTFEEDNADFYATLKASVSGRAYFDTFTAWYRENGLDWDAETKQPDHILALLPRALQPFAERVPSRVRFVGPCLDPERLADASWSPPTNGRRVLLVSFGTAYTEQLRVYRSAIEAFGVSGERGEPDPDLGDAWHVVMAIGQRVDPEELGPLPVNVEVHESVPQLAVLASASAFITHAGMGGCSEALWFGVPTVAIPQAVDQFANAQRLVELGVGVHLPVAEVSAESVRLAVDSVAGSEEVRARLAELSASTRAAGGVGAAADAVEQFLPK